MSTLRNDRDAENHGGFYEPEETVVEYLCERPALLLTMLDIAEHYVDSPDRNLDRNA